MKYQEQAERLCKSYHNTMAWGNGDHEDALQTAIKGAFPDLQDDGKAELYAVLADKWAGYDSGFVSRKLWVSCAINEFMSGRAGKASAGLKVSS